MSNEKLPFRKFILIDADTNENKGEIKVKPVPGFEGQRLEPIFTDEQKKVKNKRIEMRTYYPS